MKFMLLIYNDPTLLAAMPASEFDATMNDCITHADELRGDGYLLDSQQLEEPATAKSLRVRKGKQTIVDGPFSESKEVLGGFNLIEAENMEEALKIAAQFPWAETGCVEVRPVRDFQQVRERVSGSKRTAKR
ncbi:MAG: YciI family protein [Gemmatimonadaceae bacterium]